MLGGEATDEEWDKNDNTNVADGDDTHILIKWGVTIKCHSTLFYSILFYSILFYSILFYSIIFYSILFCSIYVLCRSTLAIMSVQFLLSFDACSTSHAVQVPPILIMILLINVILCLPLARFP